MTQLTIKDLPTKFSVTAEHIEAGQQSCLRCPIALAVAEQLPEGCFVEVGPIEIVVRRGESAVYSNTTAQQEKFMSFFDNGLRVYPFEFNVFWASRE